MSEHRRGACIWGSSSAWRPDDIEHGRRVARWMWPTPGRCSWDHHAERGRPARHRPGAPPPQHKAPQAGVRHGGGLLGQWEPPERRRPRTQPLRQAPIARLKPRQPQRRHGGRCSSAKCTLQHICVAAAWGALCSPRRRPAAPPKRRRRRTQPWRQACVVRHKDERLRVPHDLALTHL